MANAKQPQGAAKRDAQQSQLTTNQNPSAQKSSGFSQLSKNWDSSR
jgi:hypothetical protein